MMSVTSDQQRFLFSHMLALTLALPYRYIPQKLRNHYNFFPGILMVYYCFGRQANSFVLFSAISYLICKHTPYLYVQRVTMLFSLAFLSYAHLSRQIIDYGGYKIDISGPYMIAVQKVTSLGYCIHDGFRTKSSKKIEIVKKAHSNKSPVNLNKNFTKEDLKDTNNNNNSDNTNNNNNTTPINNGVDGLKKLVKNSSANIDNNASDNLKNVSPKESVEDSKLCKLTEEQVYYGVKELPTLLEFMGYFFHFPSVLCGPIMYYNDYKDFIDYPKDQDLPPGRFTAVFKKLAISTTCTLLILNLMPKFEVELLRSQEFLHETPLIMRFYYLLIFTMLSRLKYYVAWHLGEAVSNASGLGFSGYDANKKPQWDLISNMDIYKFETCLNFREAILAWNKSTQTWLRRSAYERAPRNLAILSTYCLSALWHGFYPGYYMTFLTGALFTYAARSGRRKIKPYFQQGDTLPRLYDVITFILTRLALAYVAFPFVILDFKNNWAIYRSLYFSFHLLAFGAIALSSIICRK